MTQLEALKAIYEREGRKLLPGLVVEEARAEESPLHGAFCWDDGEAAARYRILQAQELIRSFRVEIVCNDKPVVVPVFVNVSTDRNGRRADNPYRMTIDLQSEPDLREAAVADALDQLEALRNRHAHLLELADVWADIDRHVAKRRRRK